ncbi:MULTISPECIES: hypothetical protein [Crossiella]|uniref:Cbb3-type cytochrome oxidase subunit 3 n=1 Tax=Crossiella cryophila TaxID=43355 RepID=A0A7W7C4Q6_9PSEU|nr:MULTISPECIES: hypothetical protein [Crossiella]MBB4674462.1 cbb3-type cytochrome oxidase subunit 3 [Crossiella cryophila]MCK2236747.1 hypothetical protein [Crossiella sp. S99.2]MCK2250415.1 hypothetical protein [Crossiella sp. S99.1]
MLYLYLLAVIGAVTVGALMWRAFGPEKRPRSYRAAGGPLAPDDDPDFLRRLDENRRDQKRKDTDE